MKIADELGIRPFKERTPGCRMVRDILRKAVSIFPKNDGISTNF